jgi:hypothetical protein
MKRTMTFLSTLMLSMLLLTSCSGPLGPFAGGALQGTSVDVPQNWDTIAAVEHVQLETVNEGKPRSVLIWVGTIDGRLYIATSLISGASSPADRTWVKNVTANPNIRLRVGDLIYQLQALRELDPARLAAARTAMMSKYDVESDEQSKSAWLYELQKR